MKLRTTPLLLVVALAAGCGYLRNLFPHRTPVKDDTSILFPRFFEHLPVEVGTEGQMYEMDGETLRALAIASNDYLPPDDKDLPCPSRRGSQLYRVIRQENIIFVYIHENFLLCGRQYPVRHSGSRYAISTDGRILRRLIGDQPEEPIAPETPDDGGRWIRAEPGFSSEFEARWNSQLDGGTDAGTAPRMDAGTVGTDAG
jgi:hypothetical protein